MESCPYYIPTFSRGQGVTDKQRCRRIECEEGGSILEEKMLSARHGALFLTGLSAVSQLLGFGYRVLLSRMAGAEVMGLYQLSLPVYSVLLSLTAVGLTAAVSNLTSQYLALGNRRAVSQTLSTCLKLFFLVLIPLGAAGNSGVGRHFGLFAGGCPDPAGPYAAGAVRGADGGGKFP